MATVIGFDIGGTKIGIGVGDESGPDKSADGLP